MWQEAQRAPAHPRSTRATARVALGAVVAFAVVALTPQRASSDDLPDERTLRARSHAAYGTEPEQYRETVELTGSSASGRRFGTQHLARHWTVHDETTGADAEYSVRAVSVDPVADDDVAVPTIRRQLVEYPAGQNRVVLPAVFEPSGHILVRLNIGGRGHNFVLDTGASSMTIDPGAAASLGLTVTNRQQSSVNAGRYPTGQAVVHEIDLGPLVMHDVAPDVVPLNWEEPGAREVGLLGFDFLCESGITIDYDQGTVTAERYGSTFISTIRTVRSISSRTPPACVRCTSVPSQNPGARATTAESLFKASDLALYEAKRNRNSWRWYESTAGHAYS
jgi:predicted aspartyl protease